VRNAAAAAAVKALAGAAAAGAYSSIGWGCAIVLHRQQGSSLLAELQQLKQPAVGMYNCWHSWISSWM
jgi:hypothetical protein